ncbi:MAG: HNH endonuclease signature motif containing protein [Prosthecobacter sp.]
MNAQTKQMVRERAGNRCEYCRLQQQHEPLVRFHIEHVIARQHEGGDEPGNLALACFNCNVHKGTNLAGIDPDSNQLERLFNPRLDDWEIHFDRNDAWIVGKTAIGRTTVWLLEMNSDERVELRQELSDDGKHL